MESGKKWVTDHIVTSKKNGIYVHYSPPKLLGANSPAQLRQWARAGDASKLERAVLAGQGRRVLHEARAQLLAQHLSPLYHKCEALHACVERGSLLQLQAELESEFNKRKFIMCRDEAGVGLLHKAIYYGFLDIAEWLVKNFPPLVHQRDSEGRTPLHYASACREEALAAALLEGAGASRSARDGAGHTPAYYRGVGRSELALPTVKTPAMARENRKNPTGLVIKRSNIRIWCHDCDMGKLQRIVWEGHGTMLLREVSNQPVVKRFLEAVPFIMNTIRDIHYCVIHNDLEGLMKHAGDPVPPQALSCRDGHNLTVTHKAAGLGHVAILKYITNRYPQGLNDVDNDGRTPLHYAASSKDDMHAYNTLVFLGADESILDKKNKTAAFYIGRTQEIEKGILKMLPEAPRTPSSVYPSTWDWSLLDTNLTVEYNKKSKRRNFKSSENISTYNTDTRSTHYGGMKQSSTHEYISDMAGFNDPITKSKSTEHIARNQVADVDENKDVTLEDDHDEHEVKENHKGQENEKQKSHIEEAVEVVVAEDGLINGDEEVLNGIENPTEFSHKINEASEDKADKTKNNQTESSQEINEASDDKADEAKNKQTESSHEINDASNDKADEAKKFNGHSEEEKEFKIEENTDDIHNESDDRIADEKTENDEINNTIARADNPSMEDELKHDNEVEIEREKHSLPIRDTVVHEDGDSNDTNEDTNAIENSEILEHSLVEEKQSRESKDDEDVHVQGENQSEYSEIDQRSTAEASDGSAKRGNSTSGRNTQESIIEGIVKEETEMDSQDAGVVRSDLTIGGEVFDGENEIDPEVGDLVNTANMEMLAALVLNGEGSRLVGRVTHNFEVQAFLDNVPTYMKKIQRVHLAAREGNIRELQAALDRRKFAIARDPVSPNGATPLHLATVFGKTNIIKYLGGRFPETLSAVDFEGRTALHYAAVLPDNGHYYNLLQQLGANSKDLDDNGRSADEYHKNPSLLSFHQLASDFGLNEDAMQTMLADRGSSNTTAPSTTNTNGHMDIPIFRTEEGRYLAKSLGDPLIKGLTEVANVKPKDPVAFLASFLHNFPAQEKPRLGTQETKIMITKGAPEVENEQAPPGLAEFEDAPGKIVGNPGPFDVITVDPQYEEPNDPSQDAPEAAFSSADRDEHGQSMLHFAAARTHTRNALFDLLQESDINLGFRDELYRTARDVSIQANVPENTAEIDRWVLQLAARGKTDKLMELLLEGYDHIVDVVDDEGVSIQEVISQRGHAEIASFLESIPPFEESRESLHNAIRRGDLTAVKDMVGNDSGRTLARAKNSFSRSALHVAVLAQNEEIVAYLAKQFPELLRLGDNIERTPLHYAMGVDKIESLSRLLIKAGAKRVLKDLKGRQPSYYFMNKSDILRLKEEEEVY